MRDWTNLTVRVDVLVAVTKGVTVVQTMEGVVVEVPRVEDEMEAAVATVLVVVVAAAAEVVADVDSKPFGRSIACQAVVTEVAVQVEGVASTAKRAKD